MPPPPRTPGGHRLVPAQHPLHFASYFPCDIQQHYVEGWTPSDTPRCQSWSQALGGWEALVRAVGGGATHPLFCCLNSRCCRRMYSAMVRVPLRLVLPSLLTPLGFERTQQLMVFMPSSVRFKRGVLVLELCSSEDLIRRVGTRLPRPDRVLRRIRVLRRTLQ